MDSQISNLMNNMFYLVKETNNLMDMNSCLNENRQLYETTCINNGVYPNIEDFNKSKNMLLVSKCNEIINKIKCFNHPVNSNSSTNSTGVFNENFQMNNNQANKPKAQEIQTQPSMTHIPSQLEMVMLNNNLNSNKINTTILNGFYNNGFAGLNSNLNLESMLANRNILNQSIINNYYCFNS